MINLNDDNFEETINSNSGNLLVDFWADWCQPCKVMLPVLQSIEDETFVQVAKINIEENPAAVDRYQIKSIPTLVLFEHYEAKNVWIGVTARQDIIDALGGFDEGVD